MINQSQEKSFKALIKKYTGFSDNQVDYHFYILKHHKITHIIDLCIDNEIDKTKISGKFHLEMRNWNKGIPIYEIRFLQKKPIIEISDGMKNYLLIPQNGQIRELFRNQINFTCLLESRYYSFDFELNRLFTCKESEVKIPETISNYILKPFEITALKNGFPIVLKDIFNDKKGKIHNSIIQVNAIKKGLKFQTFNEISDLKPCERKMFSRFFGNIETTNYNDAKVVSTIELKTEKIVEYPKGSKLKVTPKIK